MTTDDEALVATLQLLLGDSTDERKRVLFYKAFPNSFVMLKGDVAVVTTSLRDAYRAAKAIEDMADGSSPLGILAVHQVNTAAKCVRSCIASAAHPVGVNL